MAWRGGNDSSSRDGNGERKYQKAIMAKHHHGVTAWRKRSEKYQLSSIIMALAAMKEENQHGGAAWRQ